MKSLKGLRGLRGLKGLSGLKSLISSFNICYKELFKPFELLEPVKTFTYPCLLF